MNTSTRGKITVLVSGIWLYGTANRLEFARAVGSDERYSTFRLTKHRWEGGVKIVSIVGSRVGAWEWLTAPATKARPKRRASTKAARKAPDSLALTADDRSELALDIEHLDPETVSMLCIAANVNSVGGLTQASLPAFREALAAYSAGVSA